MKYQIDSVKIYSKDGGSISLDEENQNYSLLNTLSPKSFIKNIFIY